MAGPQPAVRRRAAWLAARKRAGDELRETAAGAIDGEQPQTVEHYDELFAVAVLRENVWDAVDDSVGPLDTDDIARENFLVIANQQPVHVDFPQGREKPQLRGWLRTVSGPARKTLFY